MTYPYKSPPSGVLSACQACLHDCLGKGILYIASPRFLGLSAVCPPGGRVTWLRHVTRHTGVKQKTNQTKQNKGLPRPAFYVPSILILILLLVPYSRTSLSHHDIGCDFSDSFLDVMFFKQPSTRLS